MDTLVLVSRTAWAEVPRLRHQVAESLSPFYRVLFVELPGAWVRHGLVRRGVRRLRDDLLVVSLGNAALPPERLLAASSLLRRRLRRSWVARIERAVARHPVGRVVLLNFAHDLPGLMRSPVFDAAVYVCNDDWPALARRRLREETELLERETAHGAGLCLAVSHPLKERLTRENPRTELLLPGHSFGAEVPAWRRPAPPYVLCFMGFLNERIETGWLLEVLRDPGWELRLIGRREPSFGHAGALLATGRCRFLGELRGSALFDAMSSAHVLSLPYRMTPANMAATVPNKLYAYLATGRPVVGSALPHLLDLPRHVLARAESAREFAAVCREAADRDCEEHFQERVRLAAEQTWEKRALWLRDRIESLTPAKRVPELRPTPEQPRDGG